MKALNEMSKAELIEVIENMKAKKVRTTVRYRRTDQEINDKDLNPQKRAILKNLPKDEYLTVVEIDQLAVDSGELITAQERGRIAGYYKQNLLELGYIEAEKTTK